MVPFISTRTVPLSHAGHVGLGFVAVVIITFSLLPHQARYVLATLPEQRFGTRPALAPGGVC